MYLNIGSAQFYKEFKNYLKTSYFLVYLFILINIKTSTKELSIAGSLSENIILSEN